MKIKEGGGMDFQKEREAFQKFCEENFDFERHEQTYFDEQTQCYENDIGEDTESINMAWSAWQAAKAQAVPDLSELQERIAGHQYYHDEHGHMVVDMDDVVKEISGFNEWKDKAVPEATSIGDELQSWVAVNSFAASDAVGDFPVIDANALAEVIEKLTGASQ